jgi:hypothetical protein
VFATPVVVAASDDWSANEKASYFKGIVTLRPAKLLSSMKL